MDIKELKKFENYLLEKHSVDVDDLIGIKFVEDENEYKIVGANWAVELEDACTELNVGWDAWQAAKASAVPDGFILVSKSDVYDHYIANHLKGTTCSVDVSNLTGNDGDRIYGKLREHDCLGSDGNTLIYDLESSNFKLAKRTGNTGDYVLVPKEPAAKINNAGLHEYRKLIGLGPDGIGYIYKAMIEAAQEQSNE